MGRLAEYMAALARLLGQPDDVHFDQVQEGSAVLVAKVDDPAIPKVRERVRMVRTGGAQSDASKAYQDLDELLRQDNATGELSGGDGALVVPFPGRERLEPVTYGPFRQEGSLDGQLVRIGGIDETVHLQLADGGEIHTGLNATRDKAREIAKYLFGPTLRVHGVGRWFRDAAGAWLLKEFKVTDFEILSDAPLDEVVTEIRKLKSSKWHEVPDAVQRLLENRHGEGGTG